MQNVQIGWKMPKLDTKLQTVFFQHPLPQIPWKSKKSPRISYIRKILQKFYSTQFFMQNHETFSKWFRFDRSTAFKRQITWFPLFYAKNQWKEDLKKIQFFWCAFLARKWYHTWFFFSEMRNRCLEWPTTRSWPRSVENCSLHRPRA